MRPIISLLTDFGLTDSYVGEVKAVISTICPDAEIIDITHDVRKFDIRSGAFLLASAAPYFPKGTVHLAVVDPGVGSKRRPIAVETTRAHFVGPDNGLLIPAAEKQNILHVFELTNRSLMMEAVSSTFHGRDIFAPAAARLACGANGSEFGAEISDYVKLSVGEPKFTNRHITCEIIHVDRFGNLVTNIPGQALTKLGGRLVLSMRGRRIPAKLVNAYTDVEGKQVGFLVGGHGYVEFSCRESSASRRLSLGCGDVLRIRLDEA